MAEEAFGRDGFYATGDLGFLRAGELFVTGRKKEIMILSGENHHPSEIDWVASRVEGITPWGVAALGITDPSRGTELLALLVEDDGSDATARNNLAAALRRAIHDSLAVTVAQIRFVPRRTIPMTTSGKIKRGLLPEIFRKANSDAVDQVAPNAT